MMFRALNTPLPSSPPTNTSPYSTPPSSFPRQFGGDVELASLTLRRTAESPFDDRHSIAIEEMTVGPEEEDPFEYQHAGGPGRQKTMPGYEFAGMSPPGRNVNGDVMTFGAELEKGLSETRRSLYPTVPPIPNPTLQEFPDMIAPPSLPPARAKNNSIPVKPTFRGLFTLSQPSDYVFRLLPAILVSIAASLIQPYMSIVIGNTFAVFTAYPVDPQTATSADRSALVSGIRHTTIQLVVAGGIAAVLNYAKAALWILHGEGLVDRLREAIYEGTQRKGMDWFDTGMGMKEDAGVGEKGESVGAGGLMAKFTRYVIVQPGCVPRTDSLRGRPTKSALLLLKLSA